MNTQNCAQNRTSRQGFPPFFPWLSPHAFPAFFRPGREPARWRGRDLRVVLLAALLLAPALRAEEGPSPEQTADWSARLERAAALQAQGKAQEDAADRAFERDDAACYRKFLVNACRKAVQSTYVEASNAARRILNEGKALERDVKREQLLDKDTRRIEDAPRRAAELEARREETATARAEAVRQEETRRTEKDRRSEEGLRRKAEEAERHQRRVADHEARVAQKMQDAERRAAQKASERQP